MKQRLWIGISSSLIAGSLIGMMEAVVLLLGVGAGEYDALFWGAFGYGIAGVLFSPILVMGTALPWLREWSMVRWWSLYFGLTLLFFSVFVFAWPLKWILPELLVLPVVLWLTTIFLSRTPLKILSSVKGTAALYFIMMLLLGVFSLTPGRNIYAPPVHMETSQGRKNILLLLVDGLRVDHLRSGLTPAIDSLAQRSLSYERAFANAPTNYRSVAGMFSAQMIQEDDPLAESYTTLAEHLAYQGYQTFALVNHPEIGRFSNLHQGFDSFRFLPPFSPIPLNEGARRLHLYNALMVQWARWSATPNRLYRSARDVFFQLQKEINRSKSRAEPWFAVVQIREAQPPLFYQRSDGGFTRPVWPEKSESEDVFRAYADEVRRIDENIGRLLLFLRQSNLEKETIIVLTSSVSTQLRTLQYHAPNRPNPHHLQVPLLISLPGAEGKKIRQRVQLMDLPRTVTSLVGIAAPPTWQGVNILRLPPKGQDRPIFASFEDVQMQWEMVQQGKWKYVRYNHRREELYNVEQDPFEEDNLAEQALEQKRRMMELLQQRRESDARR